MRICMQARTSARRVSVFMSAAVLIAAVASPEPIEGQLGRALVVGDGRYIIASYSSPFIVIWDMNRIWDDIQATQVHAILNATLPAASENGEFLAYANEELKQVFVCRMGPGFPCRVALTLGEAATSLALSRDGSQLIVVSAKELIQIDLIPDAKIRQRTTHQRRQVRCVAVDWRRQQAALGTADGELMLVDLSDGVSQNLGGRGRGRSEDDCAIAFTRDGKRLVAATEHLNASLILDRRVDLYEFASPAVPASRRQTVDSARTLLVDESGFIQWYVASDGDLEWRLTPASPAGETSSGSGIRLNGRTDEALIAVNQTRGYAVFKLTSENQLRLVDLRTGWPFLDLYSSKVVYTSRDGDLAHLSSRLGAEPPLALLEKISVDQPKALWWLASIVTNLRIRYDRAWFSLLTALRSTAEDGGTFADLGALAIALAELNVIDDRLHVGAPAMALARARAALQARKRALGPKPLPLLNLHGEQLGPLLQHYWPVVERELWLRIGQSSAALRRSADAKRAYREVLEREPRDWRAYSGLLQLALAKPDSDSCRLLLEAQEALRLHGWIDREPFSYSKGFFDPAAIQPLGCNGSRMRNLHGGSGEQAPQYNRARRGSGDEH